MPYTLENRGSAVLSDGFRVVVALVSEVNADL